MRYSALPFLASILVGSAPAAADTLAPVPHPVAAGAFRSLLPRPGMPVPSASGVTYTGTIVVDFTITLRSDISTQTPIYCSLIASLGFGDTNGYADVNKDNYVEATRSGSSAACKVSLPYSLSGLLTPTKDDVSVEYEIAAGASLYEAATSLAPIGASIVGNIPISTLPANGKTTTLTVAATL